jgi:hypothetical protein
VRLAESKLLAAVAVLAAGLLLAPGSRAGGAFGKGNGGGGLFDSVIVSAKGNLYGTAWGGGAYGYGTVFVLRKGSGGRWAETVLHSFCANPPRCGDGDGPVAGLALDTSGNLFGATSTTTFELSPDFSSPNAWSFQVLYDSGSGSSLILDRAGNLYGPIGPGSYGGGAVTELSHGANGWTRPTFTASAPSSTASTATYRTAF